MKSILSINRHFLDPVQDPSLGWEVLVSDYTPRNPSFNFFEDSTSKLPQFWKFDQKPEKPRVPIALHKSRSGTFEKQCKTFHGECKIK